VTNGPASAGGRRRQPDPHAISRLDAREAARTGEGDVSDTRRSRRAASPFTQALNTRPRGRHAEGPRPEQPER
jgi:hypothetical protein